MEAAVANDTIGCIHEHIESGLVCRHHRHLLIEGRITCPACLRCSEPHLCVMRGRVTA